MITFFEGWILPASGGPHSSLCRDERRQRTANMWERGKILMTQVSF